ncbi:MAG: M23 family metallopeptidase [Leptolyngbyaceae bacterium]|nr:M23 family metallopeptidase [Leptolyngbyaceae bacterium]
MADTAGDRFSPMIQPHQLSQPPAPLSEWGVQAIQVPPADLAFTPAKTSAAQPQGGGWKPWATQGNGIQGNGAKTIAIDVAPEAEIAVPNAEIAVPNVVEMNEVQVAAQIWASASFPVEGFQAYTSPFGYRASPTGGYRKEFHYGLDIAAPRRSYIRNWWAGTVVEVSDGTNCGTSAVIQSGEWTHIYCHMEGRVENRGGTPYLVDRDGGVELRQGQQIAAGDRIGRVGMTGRTTGPHLHWGLKYQSNWVDPAWVLQAMAASYNALYGQ